MKNALFLLLALTCVARSALAQETDVLTGRVVDEGGDALVGARVEALSLESEITRSSLTDRNGRFMINFPDGGGRYLLRITYIGKADFVRTLVREGDEELLLANVTMTAQPIALDPINAVARRPQPSRGQTGEQTTELSQDLLNRLPLPDLDPNTLALLAAGVVATELDSLSGRTGFSVAGMSDLLNQIVLDGMILGESALQVPQEGIRRTSVTTSTFDASRGGFAGGQVRMTSARGNNRTGGALSYSLDNDAFQLGSAATVNGYSRQNLGGSMGGPLVPNRLFYNFALGLQRNVNHRFALAANDELSAQRAGVAPDSVNRFLAALNAYGIPVDGAGQYDQLRDNLAVQFRTDWNLVQKDRQSHTLSLRLNASDTNEDSTRINTLELTQHGGETEGDNWAAALTFASRFGTNWTNSVTASFNESWNRTDPYLVLPEGRVLVTSDFDDATRGTQKLVFGGNRNMPSDAYSKGLQLSNDLSFLLPIGTQLHRLKAGVVLQKSRNVSQSLDNMLGTFSFNSIEDLENNAPVRFERTLANEQSRIGSLSAGLYLGDTWRVTEPLEITAGLRWDYTGMDAQPAYNPAIDAAFGRRTDIEPVATTLSPRLGFNYRLAASEGVRSARTISGGIGLFAGQTPSSIFAVANRQTGLADAERKLVCIGDLTPVPDWNLYLSDPSAIPTSCAGGGTGGALSARLPSVTLINPDQRMPASLRAELGYRTRLPLNINANVRYGYARGYGLWGYYDINLDASTYFLLGTEQRPFFGAASGIVTNSGQTTLAASRRFSEFGNVYDVRADRSSSAHQVTTQLSGMLPKGITLSANYTLSFARDQGAGHFMPVPTAASPNDVEWAASSQDRRHTLNLTVSKAITQELELTAMTRLASGTPFTPMVGGDINGDGLNNDRAFVFNPLTSGDSALADGMSRLLENVSDRVADCLTSQFGKIAERNSCRNGWSRSLDMRASLRPNLPHLERRLTVSVDANHILNGLDQLFNGDNLKGWGETQRVDNRLLEVRGFDVAQSSFVYEINEAFGQNRRGASASRNPFALRISARVTIGGQPFMSNRGFGAPMAMGADIGGPGGGMHRDLGGGGAGGFGGGGFVMGMLHGEAGNPDSIAMRAFSNPIRGILALGDSITLTEPQTERLTAIADSLDRQLSMRRETLRESLSGIDLSALATRRQRADGPPDMEMGGPPAEFERAQRALQPALEAGRSDMSKALQTARRELTTEQWQRVPLSLRAGTTPAAGRGGFNAIGLIDRMLANPLPVLLDLRDTLQLQPEQIARIETISRALQQKLNERRTELGKKLDNMSGQDQRRVFMELQPMIESTRNEVSKSLKQVQRVMTAEQWQRVPEQVRNPFQRAPARPRN